MTDGIKLDVYITEQALNYIIVFDDKYPNLNKIFGSKLCNLYVNLSQDEIYEKVEDLEGDLNAFLKSNDLPIPKSCPEAFDDLEKYGLADLDRTNPRSIFIISRKKEDALKLQKMYGLIIESEDSIDDNMFDIQYMKAFDKNDIIDKNNNDGWDALFKDFVFPPMNAIVVADEHLMDNSTKRDGNIGHANIKSMLSAILPTDYNKVFDIAVLTGKSVSKAKKMADELWQFVHQIRSYKFNLEIIYSESTHKRGVYSNYFIIVCDKGFKLFWPMTAESYDDNDISVESIFNDLRFRGDSNMQLSDRRLMQLNKSYEEACIQNERIANSDVKVFRYNDGKPEKNRLLAMFDRRDS
ncbi:hypothetical protein [Prevotella sp. AGR2160]|uniref:hypothetical protein n=1 Tax=Prevotella sp. AGR2160 TaxID=1280674 RepID=UPI00040B696A|nr:hypothetical protein [Prevotella sp. AGR2160]